MKEKKDFIEDWIRDYPKENTQKIFRRRIRKFIEWSNKTPQQLVKIEPKELKHMVIDFIRDYKAKGIANNSIRAYVQCFKLFLGYYGIAIKLKKSQLPEAQEARGYHDFSNGDLGKMFQLASLQHKALISTHCSSGFSIGDILALDKAEIKRQIEDAKKEGKNYVFIETRRIKTNAKGLLVLNPLAVEWLKRWISQNKEEKLFTISINAYNIMLQKLAKRSGITGKIRSHNIRVWTINSLIKSGFSEPEWKFIVAKSVGISDATYLRLKPIIEEKYPQVYDKFLNIQPKGTIITDKKAKELLESKDKEIQALRTAYESLQNQVNRMSMSIDTLMNDYTDRRGPQQTEPKS